MKVEIQKAGDCRVKLIINATAEEVRPDNEKIVGLYMERARLPGFRPGKAPRPVVERRFQREISEDVRQALISRFYRQASEQEKIEVENIVDVADVVFSPDTGISFVLTVDVAPVFKLPKYQKIPLKVNAVEIDDAKVDQQLDALRTSLSRYEVTEEPVAAGDMAQIDFSATCGGKPLAETVADCGRYAAGTGFWTRAAEPEFIPGIAARLVGLKVGEAGALTVKFPKEFAFEALRGVKADYAFTVKEVRRGVPPEDGEVCKQYGMESIDALRDRIRASMKQEAVQAEENRQQQEVADYLLRKCDFPLPQSMVAAETQQTLRRMLGELGQQAGINEYVEKHREEILGNASASAANRVRLGYIFRAIAQAESITVDEADVRRQLDGILHYQTMQGEKNLTLEKLRERLDQNGGMRQIRQELLNAKVVKWLVADAKA